MPPDARSVWPQKDALEGVQRAEPQHSSIVTFLSKSAAKFSANILQKQLFLQTQGSD
jgi:hypothetical protein